MTSRRRHWLRAALSLALGLYLPLLMGAVEWVHTCGSGPRGAHCDACPDAAGTAGPERDGASYETRAPSHDLHGGPVCAACHFGAHSRSLAGSHAVLLAGDAGAPGSPIIEDTAAHRTGAATPIVPRAPPSITTA
jgi:hypothetical protein